MEQLETDIARWRSAITRDSAVDSADADELESHLRDQIAELIEVGLSEGEAFQIAVQRLGRVDELTAEFSREHGERLWKQLVLPVAPAEKDRRPLAEMIAFAVLAAVLVQVGRILAGIPEDVAPWFLRNLGLLVLPVLIGYFAWRRKLAPRFVAVVAACVAVLVLLVNLYPFAPGGQTNLLTAIHVPVLLWFLVGVEYLGGELRVPRRRMEFVRFTGEWVIYWVLLALGGGVLMALTILVLKPIAPAAVIDDVVYWVLPSGAAAAVIVAAWLVEAKKRVIENLAPVLAAIFTPLFALMLIVSAITYLAAGVGREFDRDLVTVFDLLLLVVFGLVLYSVSAREATKPVGLLDVTQLVAVAAALVLDALVVGSLFSRIEEFGFTANRVSALGLNLILVVNLAGTAWFLTRMLARRATAAGLERWQTAYLPVFGLWAAIVALVLPLLFAFA
ncbi:MAG: hypothetical protein EPN91_05375 [Salinibacterium sp.]|nr:MAG: hypothetical protein EPN91_05375 [Salinibacterium sp.]